MRLFVALALPEPVEAALLAVQAGVPGARWQNAEQLHLTLRFIGEANGATMRDIDDVLAQIEALPFDLELKGVGEFGGNKPHSLWAGVVGIEPLHHLNRKIESALQRIGLPPDSRKFSPHVTLARLKGTPKGAVIDFLADHALFAAAPFAVSCFALFSSKLTPDGSLYRIEREYRLA
jgi:RNA 2',3'-cyclic 3'-phosphodiesterase